MALEDHLRLKLLVDGVFQIKLSTIKVSFDSGAQEVDTLEGLAGKTPGSGKVKITGTGAVPLGGPEFDYPTAVKVGSYHSLQVPFGVKSYIGNGWFQTAELGQSVNQSTEIQFEWTGEFAEPK
jgi:hypothetical protein